MKLEVIYLIKFSLNFILLIKPQNWALFFRIVFHVISCVKDQAINYEYFQLNKFRTLIKIMIRF